jgi:hypothetical protein
MDPTISLWMRAGTRVQQGVPMNASADGESIEATAALGKGRAEMRDDLVNGGLSFFHNAEYKTQ